MNWFCCLLVSGVSLTDEARLALNEVARNMFRAQREEWKIRTFEVEGVVKTSFSYYAVGGVAGIMFEANVECETGTGIVRYLFQPTREDYRAIHEIEEGGEWREAKEPLHFIPLGYRLNFG